MITLALPCRGRLAQEAELLVQKIGLNPKRPYRSLQSEDHYNGIKLVFVHHKDAGMLVERGYVDLAVTAQDVLAERPANVNIMLPLGFSKCQIVLATQKDTSIHTIKDLEGQTIATSYPRFTQTWLTQQHIHATIVALHGSIEIMPALGLASGIVDSYQSGMSVRANNLRVVETLMSSQAILIGKPTVTNNSNIMHVTRLFTEASSSLAETR